MFDISGAQHVYLDCSVTKYYLVEKLLPFKESFFACNRKLSKTSRLLLLAATGNCPDHLGWMTARLTTAITCDTDR